MLTYARAELTASKSQARQQGSPPFVIPSHPKARRGGFVHIPPNQHGHEHRGPIPHPQSQQRAPPHRPGHPLVPSRDVPAAPTHIEPVYALHVLSVSPELTQTTPIESHGKCPQQQAKALFQIASSQCHFGVHRMVICLKKRAGII